MAKNFEHFYTNEAKNWHKLRKYVSLLINRGNFENSNFWGKFEKKNIHKNMKNEK